MKTIAIAFILTWIVSIFGCVVVEKSSPPPSSKVAVCHKGRKTLYVDEHAVQAHLDHGDYLGPCER